MAMTLVIHGWARLMAYKEKNVFKYDKALTRKAKEKFLSEYTI